MIVLDFVRNDWVKNNQVRNDRVGSDRIRNVNNIIVVLQLQFLNFIYNIMFDSLEVSQTRSSVT